MSVDTSAVLNPSLHSQGYAYEASRLRVGTIDQHYHQGLELLFVQRGAAEVSIGDRAQILTPGQLVIHSGYAPHSSRALSGRFERFTLYVEKELAENTNTRGFLHRIQDSGFGLFMAPPAPLLRPVLAHIHYFQSNPQSRGEIVSDILNRVARAEFSAQRPRFDENKKLITTVLAYMNEHPESNETLKSLAGRFFVSESHLRSVFREYIHYSPAQCRLELKVQKARDLLSKEIHVEAVASAVGFETRRGLERAFVRIMGMTPVQYRLLSS